MLIRKNTKTFKTILEIVTACKDRPDREKLIRLYITKAGNSIADRISVEGIQGDSALFYDLNYHSVLSNLESSERQLHQSDEIPGIYFFHSTSNKVWDETPFEFDEAIKKEFASLSDLPVVRKKSKTEKYVFPDPKVKPEPKARKSEMAPTRKEKAVAKKSPKAVDKGPRQPDYKLKRKIAFTDLDKVIFRNPQVTKKDVLDYYNKIAEYILPYLKDRPLSIHSSKGSRTAGFKTSSDFPEHVQLPDWLQTAAAKKGQESMLLCNDKSHLLFYVEMGGVQFDCAHSRTKSLATPDYIVVKLECDSEFKKIIEGTLGAKEILSGLHLPSFVKTDGQSGLHIYIPLDSKSKFEASKAAAEYICKLLRLKIPDLVSLHGSDDHSYGKVTLHYMLNQEGESLIAPYSLVAGESPTVATPLLWEEVKEGLQLEDFHYETIFKRLKQDPFENLIKKKVNAEGLVQKMEENYGFLF
jgi:bifunctional non-homologous end joining protein LigD